MDRCVTWCPHRVRAVRSFPGLRIRCISTSSWRIFATKSRARASQALKWRRRSTPLIYSWQRVQPFITHYLSCLIVAVFCFIWTLLIWSVASLAKYNFPLFLIWIGLLWQRTPRGFQSKRSRWTQSMRTVTGDVRRRGKAPATAVSPMPKRKVSGANIKSMTLSTLRTTFSPIFKPAKEHHIVLPSKELALASWYPLLRRWFCVLIFVHQLSLKLFAACCEKW